MMRRNNISGNTGIGLSECEMNFKRHGSTTNGDLKCTDWTDFWLEWQKCPIEFSFSYSKIIEGFAFI